ncbi:NRDE-2, necessary for RNA interference domain-containing protein [Hirsutella rhossiliensis]|uniref:NRDE-2, necessary for RNA interference domain-containing protein n=1 Tax=Hirsutella rhossiliensis TaxID=111463 RepID=A0A9P8N512_9HYPO|nr:NRDE-2, necessary for RNA interference domain-containing protein [Hirsutella rhossiliensis]KAH0965909.1 NRDE-2, necessary for RNA interference domain-containing protein [Hirsutella rhossiliensis]
MAAGDDDDGKLSVPKFSSFKPKGSIPSADAQSGRPKAEPREKEERRHRSSRQDYRSQHRHHNRHRRERPHREEEHPDSRDREQTPRRREEPKHLPDRGAVSSVPGLFVIDKKGDPLIRKYGLERSKVPSYYRLRGGRVLGTNGRLFLHHDGPREEFSLLFPGEKKPGSRDTGGLRSRDWQKRDPVKLRARRGKSPEDVGEGYLSLVNPKKRKRLHKNSDSSDAENQPSWRSIEGKAKAVRDVNSDAQESEGSSSESGVSDHDNPLKWKSIQLNRQVKDHPDDIEAWLELADHQDALLREGETIDDRAAENTAHSFTEIKVHLLESALTHASRPEDRQRVLVALMREGLKVWDKNVAAKKWSRLSDDELHSFELWKTHLDYSMSSIATFQYEDIKKMILKRLHQVVSRATKFFRDAGYKELAVAAWQGLLELNLFKPENAQSQSETLAAFEKFWEEESPRIGEAGAQGWRHRVESGGFEDAPWAVADKEPAETRLRDPYQAWAAAERARGNKASLPARTMDADTDDDPFRVVMYSDIEPWLFVIPRAGLPHATPQLIDAFLLSCGLPLALRSNDWLETAYHSQFLTGTSTDMRPQPAWDEAECQEASQRRPPSFSNGNCCARMSPELLFSRSSWFQYFDVAGKEHAIDLSWAETALKQLVHSTCISDLALYYLGLCFARKPDLIKKRAKALLTRYPTDVRLYNAYALAEFANGNVEIASMVLTSALESPELSAASTGFLLLKTWSWIELESGDKKMATKRLCACVDESLRKPKLGQDGLSPATILKARQAFTSNAQQCLYEGQWETASSHAECLALLSYLTGEGASEPISAGQGNISAAMDVVESMSKEMRLHECGNGASELLFQWASRMLYSHAAKGPFRRVYVREQLARFIEGFPRNTILLNLFGWADATIRVVDETRQLLYDKVLVKKHDSVSSRVFAIQHELGSGNANNTRAAFEHAICSEVCKHNVMLWVWYAGFCQSQKQLQALAKRVFYRALAHCPWSKEVMMEAFVTLVRGLEPDELRSVYETMTSKGLRIHVDLDEFLERTSMGAT